jgi:small subunit ribosomal protein S13
MLPVLYIFNKPISKTKKIVFSLTKLFGINKHQSIKICRNFGINPQISLGNLKKNQVNIILRHLNKRVKIEQKLKIEKKNNFEKLLDIKLVRGIRQNIGLPVRGQRTHTNAKTIKRLKGRNTSIQLKGRKQRAIMRSKNKK